MTKELTIPNLTTTGADYYARFVDATGQYWRGDTSAWEAYSAVNIALYGADAGSGTPYNQATEVGGTGDFTIDIPSAFAAGSYKCLVYEQSGANPVEGDSYVGGGGFEWDGTNLTAISSRPNLAQMLSGFGAITGSIIDSGSNTNITFDTDLSEVSNDHYGNSDGGTVLVFTSGTNANVGRRITGYNGTTKFVTVESAFPNVPAAADAFAILGRIEAA